MLARPCGRFDNMTGMKVRCKYVKPILKIVIIIVALQSVSIIYRKIVLSTNLKNTYTQYEIPIPDLSKIICVYIDNNINKMIDLSIVITGYQSNSRFLDISLKKPIKIIICRDDNESKRIFKYFNTKAGGFAFSDDLVIINYENAISLGYSIYSILAHELSHIIIKQNIKSWYQKIFVFSKKSLWFSEGLAVYNQGYIAYTKSELKNELIDTELKYKESLNNFNVIPTNRRSDYSIYFHFIDFIVGKYGEEKLKEFIKLMIKKYNKAYTNYYQVLKNDLLVDFSEYSSNVLDMELKY